MTTGVDGPLLICYDGSGDAKHAIERAGLLFNGAHALVLTVWQPTHALGSFAWAGATAGMVDFSSSTAQPRRTPDASPMMAYASRGRPA